MKKRVLVLPTFHLASSGPEATGKRQIPRGGPGNLLAANRSRNTSSVGLGARAIALLLLPLSWMCSLFNAQAQSCIDLTCPSDITVLSCSNCAPVYFPILATNYCSPTNLTIVASPPSGSCFPVGNTTVRITASGSGESNTCLFTVTVTNCDSSFPRIGSAWSYLDDGSDPGTAWRGLNFNDSVWPVGTAKLGFGQNDEQTQLQPGHLTYYFRRTFSVTNPQEMQGLAFALKANDGAIAYLNGLEIFRSNMPTGAPTYATPALQPVSNPDADRFFTNSFGSGVFISGLNVLAVEVHRSQIDGPSLGFDLGIVPELPPCFQWLGPESLVWPCQGPDGAQVVYNIGATNLCGPAPTVTFDPPTGTLFPVGTSEVICTAMVDGHSFVRHVPVTVLGDCSRDCLEISCPSVVIAPCTNEAGTLVFYEPLGTEAINHCNPGDVTITYMPPSGSYFPYGDTDVDCFVTGSGQTKHCTFKVRIFAQPPHVVAIPLTNGMVRVYWISEPCREFEPEENPFLTNSPPDSPVPPGPGGDPSPWERVGAPIMKSGSQRYVDLPINRTVAAKFFRLRPAEAGTLLIESDQIGIVAAAGVRLEDLAVLTQTFGISYVRTQGEDTFIFALPGSLERTTLQSLLSAIRWQYPQLVQQAGMVAKGVGEKESKIVTDEFIVQFHREVDRAAIDALNAAQSVEIVMENPFRKNHFLLRPTAGVAVLAPEFVRRYRQSSLVQFAELNSPLNVDYRAMIPNDPLFPSQWHLNNTGAGGGTPDADIDAPEAWDITTGSPDVVIAAIDGGFDVTHPDLVPNLWVNPGEIPRNGIDDDDNGFADDINGWNFNDGNNILSGGNHGTAVAGCAAARGNNALGVCGSCPNARLMLIKNSRFLWRESLTFDYARINGAAIITCSWGHPIDPTSPGSLEQAIHDAATLGRDGKGCVILFAMSNENSDNGAGPSPDISSLSDVIAVARSNSRDRFDLSGYGNCMEVMAPSYWFAPDTLGIVTTDVPGAGGYDRSDYTTGFGGTSAATPITAGVAGLILSVNPDLTREQVKQLLQDTADKIEPSQGAYSPITGFSTPAGGVATHGYGRVNAFEAVRVAAAIARGGRGGVDIFCRDNALDWGNTEQPSSVLLEPVRDEIPWWESVDIKVDAPPFQPAPTTSAQFDAFEHENPLADTVNRVYVRVRNRGPVTAASLVVKPHWAYAGTGLPALPADFWTRFPANSADISQWHPLEARTLTRLAYSGASATTSPDYAAQIAQFDFAAPSFDPTVPEPGHYCLMAVIDSPQDPVSDDSRHARWVDGITPRDNNVTHRNLILVDPSRDRSREERFYARNATDAPMLTSLRLVTTLKVSVDLSAPGFNQPFMLAPGEQRLFTVKLNNLDPQAKGTVRIIQDMLDDLSLERMATLGGLTFSVGTTPAAN